MKSFALGMAATTLIAASSFAEAGNAVGSFGGQIGYNNAKEADGSSPDEASVFFGGLNGDVAFRAGNSFIFGIDGTYRYDDFSSSTDLDDSEDPEKQITLTLHALKEFENGSRAGVFLNYGQAIAQDGSGSDSYDYYLVGLEGQMLLSPNVLTFGQIGFGDKVKDGQDDDEGFNNGAALRLGLVYFQDNGNAWRATFEHARSSNYIDSSDPGRHFGITLGAERKLDTQAPLFLDYGIAYNHFSSTDEGDDMDEFELFVGLRYVFGADSPKDRWTNGIAYGGPELPVRASAWTEWAD